MDLSLKPNLIRLNPATRLYQLPCPLIAITGGIGSGKSEFIQALEKRGAKVLKADQLVKKIYDLPFMKNLVKEVAPEAIQADKTINFIKLREAFFQKPTIKATLEHQIYQELPRTFLKEIKAEDKLIFYEIPLLFERQMEKLFDLVIVINAPEETRIERAVKRDGVSEAIIRQILKAQMPLEQKVAKADVVISNEKDAEALNAECEKFIKAYLTGS